VSQFNPPGLTSIRYRLGNQPELLARLLRRIAQIEVPTETNADGSGELRPGRRVLDGLATRELSDPTIALIDAWASVGDVLTFYQQRIANEGYLRTASERLSVLELAREIGYELAPGSSASTYLAFTVENLPQGSGRTTISKGIRVQSLPEGGQLPQTFETAEDAEMRVEWNELRPQQTTRQVVTPTSSTIDVSGLATEIALGSRLLLVTESAGKPITTIKIVTASHYDDLRKITTLELDNAPPPAPPRPTLPSVFIRPYLLLEAQTMKPLQMKQATIQPLFLKTFRDRDLGAMFGIAGWQKPAVVAFAKQFRVAVEQPKIEQPKPDLDMPRIETGVLAFRNSNGVFGHNAPAFSSLKPPPSFPDWDDANTTPTVAQRTALKPPTQAVPSPPRYTYKDSLSGDPSIFLERSLPGLAQGQWILLVSARKGATPFRIHSVVEQSLAEFNLTGKASGLKLVEALENKEVAVEPPPISEYKLRETTVHSGSYPLRLAPLAITATLGAGTAERQSLVLEDMVLDLPLGRVVILTGERADLPGVTSSEALILKEVTHSEGRSTLQFTAPIQHPYQRSSVVLTANVVAATHGETVDSEILGHGDGSRTNLSFTLRKPPLTHVPAATASGTTTTLAVRVNGILWHEAANLWTTGPHDQVYTSRIADDGMVAVTFGDGRRGARLPTGVNNVQATYRSGIGHAGRLDAERLSLLPNRPAGIRSVRNPLATEGGVDPESRDDARANAPGTVLTFGRIVSRQDLEDFARGFAGVGKSQALALQRGESPWLLLTVGSSQETPLSPTDATWMKLEAAIRESREPSLKVRIISYSQRLFTVKARFRRHPDHRLEDVVAAQSDALRKTFHFSHRRFGQPVTAAEVITVLQNTAGVVAVDLDELMFFDAAASTDPLATILSVRQASWSQAEPLPAELLTIHPLGITLEEGL
jgi:predicted phage baseplate assembly protein